MKAITWKPGLRLVFAVFAGAVAVPQVIAEPLAAGIQADKVVVLKKERKLILYSKRQELKRYSIALGGDPSGPKTQQGDHKTPEGNYVLDRRNPKSRFYRSIHISYPRPDQVAAARKSRVSPGGDVFIHGLPNGFGALGRLHLARDWTDGCIAVTNEEIDEIWRAVPNGTPIEIRP